MPRFSYPEFPSKPPPNVLAFIDQVNAAVEAGDLADDVTLHIDVGWPPGSAEMVWMPRLCTADAAPRGRRRRRDCEGECAA